MSLESHLSRGSCVRNIKLTTPPSIACLEDSLREISHAPNRRAVNISWTNERQDYSLSLTYNRLHSSGGIAHWKIYYETNYQCNLIWKHQTNDILLLHTLLMHPTNLKSLALRTEGTLNTTQDYLALAEQQNIALIRSRLRNNLRQFLGEKRNITNPNNEEQAI